MIIQFAVWWFREFDEGPIASVFVGKEIKKRVKKEIKPTKIIDATYIFLDIVLSAFCVHELYSLCTLCTRTTNCAHCVSKLYKKV